MRAAQSPRKTHVRRPRKQREGAFCQTKKLAECPEKPSRQPAHPPAPSDLTGSDVGADPARTEQLLKLALQTGRFVSWSYDPASGLDWLGRELGRLHGLMSHGTASHVRGLAVHPVDRTRVERIFRATTDWNGPVEFEMRLVCENGDERWISICAAPRVESSECSKFVGISRDITGRKRAIRALRERTTLIRLASEAARLGPCELDIPSLTLTASPICKAFFGRGPGDAFTFSDLIASIHYHDQQHLKDAVAATIRCQGSLDGEFRLMGADKPARRIRLCGCVVNRERPRLLAVCVDVTEGRRIRPGQMLTRELNHRLRNVFPLILTIVKHTAEYYPNAAAYRHGLERRLHALAAAAGLIDRDDADSVSVEDLIRLELAPFDEGKNIVVGGPVVELQPAIVQDFAMLMHELATNAVKHGALSDPRGRVSVTWSLRQKTNGGRSLALEWIERDGPKIGHINSPGFGTMIIRESGSILGGTASIDYAREGFRYRLALPANRLLIDAEEF